MKGFLEYVPGDSLLHRMNPVAKLAAAFLLVIACFATSNLVLLALVIVLDAILAVQCKMVSQTLGLAKAVALFSLVLALIALLFTPQGDVLAQLPWGYIGTGSVAAAVLIVVRLVACAPTWRMRWSRCCTRRISMRSRSCPPCISSPCS